MRTRPQHCGSACSPALRACSRACGASARADADPPTTSARRDTRRRGTRGAHATLLDWPEFGLNPQRSDVSELASGHHRARTSRHLRRTTISLPGHRRLLADLPARGDRRRARRTTRSSSPPPTAGRSRSTPTAARTLWTFTPPGYPRLGRQRADHHRQPARRPRPRVHLRRLAQRADPQAASLADGAEAQPGWPVSDHARTRRTRSSRPALNIDGPDLIAATGGYIGDIPPYQGHVVLIDRAQRPHRGASSTRCAPTAASCSVPSTLPGERLGDPLARRRGGRAGRRAHPHRHRQRRPGTGPPTSATASSS